MRLWDSVAYRERVAERDEGRRDRETVRLSVDALFRKGLDCQAIADHVRDNATLSEPHRRAATNLVLMRCSTIREQALSLIDALEERLLFVAAIRDAVESDPSLEPAVRAAAINIARWIEDSPGRFHRVARRIAWDDDRSPADLERAQRAGAFASDPGNANVARTLATVWTRLQRPEKVVEVWRENVEQTRATTPADDLRVAEALMKYATALLENDQAKEAEPVLRECLSIREKALKRNDRRITAARGVLGECLTKLAQFTEAEALLIELADAMSENLVVSDSDKAGAVHRVVDLYEAWNTVAPRQGYDAKADEWRAKLPQSPDGSTGAGASDE